MYGGVLPQYVFNVPFFYFLFYWPSYIAQEKEKNCK